SGTVSTSQDLSISLPGALTNAVGGVILSNGATTLQAATIDNAGMLAGTPSLTLTAQGGLTNELGGTLVSNGATTLKAASLDNKAVIAGQSVSPASATTIANESGAQIQDNGGLGGGGVSLSATGALTNAGTVASAGTLGLTAQSITNSGSVSTSQD